MVHGGLRYIASGDYKTTLLSVRERERMLKEAGGLVSDFNGGHDFLEKGQIVAGNAKCFKAVLTAIQPHLAPSMKR